MGLRGRLFDCAVSLLCSHHAHLSSDEFMLLKIRLAVARLLACGCSARFSPGALPPPSGFAWVCRRFPMKHSMDTKVTSAITISCALG